MPGDAPRIRIPEDFPPLAAEARELNERRCEIILDETARQGWEEDKWALIDMLRGAAQMGLISHEFFCRQLIRYERKI